MSLYVLSDTHLSFSTNKPMDIFGPRWKNHHEKIRENWLKIITEEDTVVIPGDISWAMTFEEAREDLAFLHRLPGRKIIGRGNHDYWWNTMNKMQNFFADSGFDSLQILYNNAFRAEDFILCGSRGWFNDQKAAPGNTDYNKIVQREAGRIALSLQSAKKLGDGELLMFLHFPPVFKNYLCREIVDVLHQYDIRRCWYGHIHTTYDTPPCVSFEGIDFILASADYLNFTPMPIFPESVG